MISHKIPLERIEEAIRALDGKYSLDGKETVKVCVSPTIGAD